jgi:protein-S-isoprenylcysteine O-methyltransferase Ste14
MEADQDNAGIFVPPPFFYFGLFFLSFLIQKKEPIDDSFLCTRPARIAGIMMIASGALLFLPAVALFIRRRTAILPVKPARELQTSGPYRISRNPMYVGLLGIYAGLAMCYGNWWTVLMIPVLVLIIRQYFIRREETYLERKFGQRYEEYCKRVRRWV